MRRLPWLIWWERKEKEQTKQKLSCQHIRGQKKQMEQNRTQVNQRDDSVVNAGKSVLQYSMHFPLSGQSNFPPSLHPLLLVQQPLGSFRSLCLVCRHCCPSHNWVLVLRKQLLHQFAFGRGEKESACQRQQSYKPVFSCPQQNDIWLPSMWAVKPGIPMTEF